MLVQYIIFVKYKILSKLSYVSKLFTNSKHVSANIQKIKELNGHVNITCMNNYN